MTLNTFNLNQYHLSSFHLPPPPLPSLSLLTLTYFNFSPSSMHLDPTQLLSLHHSSIPSKTVSSQLQIWMKPHMTDSVLVSSPRSFPTSPHFNQNCEIIISCINNSPKLWNWRIVFYYFFVREVFGESGKKRKGISNELFRLTPDAKEERGRRGK